MKTNTLHVLKYRKSIDFIENIENSQILHIYDRIVTVLEQKNEKCCKMKQFFVIIIQKGLKWARSLYIIPIKTFHSLEIFNFMMS